MEAAIAYRAHKKEVLMDAIATMRGGGGGANLPGV